jgi:alanine racemase
VEAPIHVFTEPPPEAASTLIELALTPTVYTEDFALALSKAAVSAGSEVSVHVKVDTGMHRVGIMEQDVPDAADLLKTLEGIKVEGVWSHLAVADHPGHPFTKKQIAAFVELADVVEKKLGPIRFRHIANSAATMSEPASHFDLVRCGVASYGLWPGPEFVGSADLHPALALRARINMVKPVPAGEALSYGLNYELPRPGRVATVPAGYADGYDRRLSGEGDILIGGHRWRVSGTVCMDQFMVDLGDADVKAGEVATLIGSDGDQRVSAEEVAERIGTINYEVTTRIPSRVPRIYLNEETG